jgi:hypothetical protein
MSLRVLYEDENLQSEQLSTSMKKYCVSCSCFDATERSPMDRPSSTVSVYCLFP